MTAADVGKRTDAADQLTKNLLGDVYWGILDGLEPPAPSFTDYIAYRIEEQFVGTDPARIITHCGPVKSDLDEQGRWKDSTRKTLALTDVNGKRYCVTVEEIAP